MGGGTSKPDQGTVPGICHSFNSLTSECKNNDCTELHICSDFAAGGCPFGDKCRRPHLLTTVHNKVVLKANGWDDDTQHQTILTKLEEKFKPNRAKPEEKKTGGLKTPQICYNYNTLGCRSHDCKSLHLCLNSVIGNCVLEGKCQLEHDLGKSGHNIQVLRSAGLLDTEQQVIVNDLREKYIAKSNQRNRPEQKHVPQEPRGREPKESLMNADADKDKSACRGAPVVCIAYNKGGCGKTPCPFLHVCFSYIMGRCNKGGKCFKGHNVFQGDQNKEILRKFDLLSAKDVYAKIREGYEARAAARAAAESLDDASGGTTLPPPPKASQSHAIPPNSLTCSVCHEAFIRATTLGCSHTFCEDCVRSAKPQCQPCPLCRAPITTAVRSLVIDDTVMEWFDSQDEETQRVRRQLEAERRRAAAVPQPLLAPAPAPPGVPPAPASVQPPVIVIPITVPPPPPQPSRR